MPSALLPEPMWIDSKWNDQMWDIADGQTFDNGWTLDDMKGKYHLYRNINGFEDGELENVKAIVNDCIYKYVKGTSGNKRNNIEAIRNSTIFRTSLNYVTTDGMHPVTLIPIQGYTTEFKRNHIYYYYYRPEDIPAGMSEVDYIKQLPKFKAICGRSFYCLTTRIHLLKVSTKLVPYSQKAIRLASLTENTNLERRTISQTSQAAPMETDV